MLSRRSALSLLALVLALASLLALISTTSARRARTYEGPADNVGYVCRDGAVVARSCSGCTSERQVSSWSGKGWDREAETWVEYGTIEDRPQYYHLNGIDFHNDVVGPPGYQDSYSVEILPWNTLVPTSTHVFGLEDENANTLTQAVINALDGMNPVSVTQTLRGQFEDAGYTLSADATMAEKFTTAYGDGYRDVEIVDGDNRYYIYFNVPAYNSGDDRVDAYFDHVIINDFGMDVWDCRLRTIEVDLTVSTDPTGCATTKAIDANAGDNVHYCVTIHNPTESVVPQDWHILNIPELGMTNVRINTDLPPGGSITLTSAYSSRLGPRTVNGNFKATASVTSYNRTLNYGGDVIEPYHAMQPSNAPFSTNTATASAKVTAVAPETHALTVNVIGNGSVTPSSGDFTAGETVALTATADEGWQFAGWGGALDGTTNPASVTMNADKTVTATFEEITSNQVFLPITKVSPTPLGNDAIIFVNNGEIYAINPDGTGSVRLTAHHEFETDRSPTWSPDRSKIAFDRMHLNTLSEIHVMNAGGSGLTRITQSDSSSDSLDEAPAWSPDGNRIAFVRRLGAQATPEIHVVNADGSGLTHLTQGAEPDWSPDGDQIVFSDGGQIYRIDADGSNRIALTAADVTALSPQWSPDSKRIAYSSARENEDSHIFVMDADGANKTELTNGWEHNPRWSPDGNQLLFGSSKLECPYGCLITMGADGSNERIIFHSSFNSPDWSPDGGQIVFVEHRWWDDPTETYYLIIAEADGSSQHDLAGPFEILGSVRWSR